MKLSPRALALWGLNISAIALVFILLPPLHQPLDYHNFIDQRSFWSIPNAWNVLSNLPFIVAGLVGLWLLPQHSADLHQRAYQVFFIGVLLTGFGSAYYHWAPDNQSLIWDRLPMTIAFMGFFASVLFSIGLETLAQRLLWPLLLVGAGSVLYWAWTEYLGRGDLRPYLLVQFLPALQVPLLLYLYRAPGRYSRYIIGVLVFYVLSKVCEASDVWLYQSLAHSVSGHSLKHLFAAFGASLIALYLLPQRSQHTSPL